MDNIKEQLSAALIKDVEEYINTYYLGDFTGNVCNAAPKAARKSGGFSFRPAALNADALPCLEICEDSAAIDINDLENRLKEKDESYVEMLLSLIDEKGMTDADCYNKAQINKANFNKIKNIEGYKAKKNTLIALGLALELTQEIMNDLLKKAGYALTNSSKFDLIIEYCIEHRLYDINQINMLLFSFDQELLGAGVRD